MKWLPPQDLGCELKILTEYSDDRGTFLELFKDKTLVQQNLGTSHKHVLRGLHWQYPYPHKKVVTVLRGRALDIAVDLRPWSPTYRSHTTVLLSEDTKATFTVPKGFAHGILALSDDMMFSYAIDGPFVQEYSKSLNHACPDLAIDYGKIKPIVSEKDRAAPFLFDVPVLDLPSG